MSNWNYTTIMHPARIKMGISVLQYCVFDIIYHSQTHPDYSFDGWASNSHGELARFLKVSKGTIFNIVDKGEEDGFLEVNPANPKLKKTTEKWYLNAYEKDISRSKNERSEIERNRSKIERPIVQKLNENVQKLNVINKEKEDKVLNINKEKESAHEKITTEDIQDFELLENLEQLPVDELPKKVAAKKVSFENQESPDWMEVTLAAIEYATGEGKAQWEFMCRGAGGYVDPSVIMTNYFGKQADSSYILRNWKKEIPKMSTWIKNELKMQKQQKQYDKTSTKARLTVEEYEKPKQIKISKVPSL